MKTLTRFLTKTFIRSFVSRDEETGHYTVTVLRLGLCGVRRVLFECSEISSFVDAMKVSKAALEAFK